MRGLLLILLCVLAVPVWAVPAAPGIKAPEKCTCFVNGREAERRVNVVQAARVKGAPLAPPSKLTPKVLVVRVSFTGAGGAMATSYATATAFYDKMRAFWSENSYGVFVPSFTVTNNGAGAQGEYVLSGTMSTYGSDCSGDVACNDEKLFTDTKAKVEAANLPATYFDAFDQVMIYHAGDGQESTGADGDLWSLFFPNNNASAPSFTAKLGNKTFDGFTLVPESESGIDPLGVICHEYGHQLGLPDIYDTSVSGGRSTVGVWDLMDYPYAGTPAGSNPPHLGAWEKSFLGFNSVSVSQGAVPLGPAESVKGGFNRINVTGAGSSNEYFLMEYRWKADPAAAYDKGLPMSGMAIWHIDDDIASNATALANNTVNAPSLNGRGHRGVDMVEADRTEVNPVLGDLGSGNAFIDSQTFSGTLSNSFSGLMTGISAGFSGVGGSSVLASVVALRAAAVLLVVKTTNYPNPGGDTAKYPVRAGAGAGTVTTLVIQLSKPVEAGQLSLDIFNMDGDRLRTVSGANISLQLSSNGPSADYKWVYEYDWDGKDDDGNSVASGVYWHRFKAGSETVTGKLVLIR